jgi:multiple sugar transport system permease protein
MVARSRTKVVWDITCYAVLILLAVICTFPILWTFLTSIKLEADIVTREMVYIPTRFTFESYVKLWYQSSYPTLVLNSLVVTSLTVLICLATGTVASYSFSRFQFRGRTQLMLAYLIVRMFPAVLVIIPLFIVMKQVSSTPHWDSPWPTPAFCCPFSSGC